MGNKVNPKGYRLGVLTTWDSRWFFSDHKAFRTALVEDINIRKYLFKMLLSAGLTQVEIERNLSGMTLILHSVRPGIIIGRGGKGLEEVKNKVLDLLHIEQKQKNKYKLDIKVEQVKKPFLSARYTADYLAERIVKNFAHRSMAHSVITKVMESGAQGVKIRFGGRLRGANIARQEKFQTGKVPLSSISEDIDYAQAPALTRNGYVGIKVWICR
ncbi:MAG: 30S ribosomal protein S3 [Patescibacteria group bacterium]|jgi:small subunit ribosomal protein S3